MAAVTVRVGDLLDGKYHLLRVLGEGGWGIVFEAENTRTLKHVAVKVLRPQSNLTPDIIARFEREAQAAGRIGSEHIVEVFDLGILQGPEGATHYMVLELLLGEDLATRIRTQRRLEPVGAVKLVIQLLGGLAAAHNAGILHRDLKPENLFLVPTRSGEEFVKILDFGISKFSSETVASATVTGAVMGSPCYMSPEQARGLRQLDARTDLHAVGTVLFEAVTGRVPFTGDNFNDLMFKIVLEPRPKAIDFNPSLDPVLSEIIAKAIAIDPAERFATASEFRLALVDWLDSQGVASVHQPELRRAPRESLPSIGGSTPMQSPRVATPLASQTAGPMTRRDPEWNHATLPLDVDEEGPTQAAVITASMGRIAVASQARVPIAGHVTGSGPAPGAALQPAAPAPASTTLGPGSTPLASSRTIAKPAGRSKLVFVALGLGALLLSVGGWLAVSHSGGGGDPPPQGLVVPATATVAAATGIRLAPSADALKPAAEAATAATASATAAPPPADTAAPSTSAIATPAPSTDATSAGHHHHPGKPGPAASAAPVPDAKTAPSAAPATKPPEPDKVEGRDIRSGL